MNHLQVGKRLSGLQRICKAHGRMKCGDTMMAWDYANDVALPETELLKDKGRWEASERARYDALRQRPEYKELLSDISALVRAAEPALTSARPAATRSKCRAAKRAPR